MAIMRCCWRQSPACTTVLKYRRSWPRPPASCGATRAPTTRGFRGNAAQAAVEEAFYDVILCLYFTAGNIRDKSDDLSLYGDAYLDRQSAFYRRDLPFLPGTESRRFHVPHPVQGRPEAEMAQVDFYEHTGQHVVTPRGGGSRFVATAEGFWSARWTQTACCPISTRAESAPTASPGTT